MKRLVIVESPTKAKTISKFLGKAYTVESSFGHVRDLPKSKMGVDTEHGTFAPQYLVPKDKAEHVKKLKALAKKAEEIIFATDEDREGEAISWHLASIFGVKPEEAKRIAFHEITKHAIDEALLHPRHIDQKLVDAQQARRVLDRLVGYELSPLLWSKVARGLSAGRVQSVAVRLVVEREREITAFKPEEYWTLLGLFLGQEKDHILNAELYAQDKKKLDKFAFKTKGEMQAVVDALKPVKFSVANIIEKEATRTPPPPFTTSTLQQQSNQKLGYSAKQTMRLAQELYEGVELGDGGATGLITYMRTDSVNLSEKFLTEANEFVGKEFGKDYQLNEPRKYATKSKGAQEAHEAIRPTDPMRTPESVKDHLSSMQFRLYSLIWKRAVATQMAEAKLNKTIVDIENAKSKDQNAIYTFRTVGQTVRFDGWLKLYPDAQKEEMLPAVKKGDALTCTELKPEQHFTEPPARYSDATLVKALEEFGIGRPSTYAPTIATIEDRHYVERDEQKRLKPTDIAFTVNDLLVEHFGSIVDYKFTADMEESLDQIAEGQKEWQPLISTFYHPFHETILQKKSELNKKELTEETTDEKCPKCQSPMIIKIGRFGKFMACSNYPECKTTKPIGKEAEDLANAPTEPCDKCGKPMVMKRGRFGTFMGCSGYPDCKNIKKIEKKTGVKCNKCGLGEFVEKKSKRGKPFYSCNRYPDCENALWSKPTGELCPTCSSPLVFAAKGAVKCSSKECGFEKMNETTT